MRGWRTPRRTSAPWSPMKSSNKGPQMSRMGQGALGPEGRRAADVQYEPPPPATERGSLRSTDKRRVTVLPKRGFRRHKYVRAAPKRKAHTAIRPGELPRGLKERAPYMNQGRSHSAIKTGEPTLRLERESLDGIWMGEPTRRFEWESPLQEW